MRRVVGGWDWGSNDSSKHFPLVHLTMYMLSVHLTMYMLSESRDFSGCITGRNSHSIDVLGEGPGSESVPTMFFFFFGGGFLVIVIV